MFLQVIRMWSSFIARIKDSRAAAVSMQQQHHFMLTRACLKRWRWFRSTISSTRASISRAIDLHIISSALLCWKQSALFQAAAREILAAAAAQSVQELRCARGGQSRTAVAVSVMREWRRVCCDCADVRSRVNALQALVLGRMVARSFCRWSRNSARITSIRALVHEFEAVTCDRKLRRTIFVWASLTSRAKRIAERMPECREKLRVFLMSRCLGVFKRHLTFRRKMKACVSDVFALSQRLRCALLRGAVAAWRAATGGAGVIRTRRMFKGLVAAACSFVAASHCAADGEELP